MPSKNLSSEKKLRRLNTILRAIRNVNQLIVSEKDWRTLVTRICKLLKENQGFHNAWIVLFDDKGAFVFADQAGVGNAFRSLKNRLKDGKRDTCLQAALKQEGVVVIHDPYNMCHECPLHDNYAGRGGLSVRLQYENRLYGALTVSVSPDFISDADVHDLLKEVAGDLSFALHSLELEDERKKTAIALQDREENLRITLNSIGDAVISTDVKGNVARLNSVAEQLTGWSNESARGLPLKKVFKIINEETRKKVESPVDKVMREGRVAGLANHTLLIAKDGRETPIADSGAPIANDNGQIVGVVLVFRDQTEERAAQKEIAEAKRFAESIIATVREPLLVLDAHLKVVSANHSFYRKFGATAEHTENKYLYKLGQGEWNVSTLQEKLLQIISQNKIVTDFEVEQDFAKIGRRTMQLNARRLSDDSDAPDMILLAIEDITERRQAAELRTRLAAIVESSDDSIIGKTTDGFITSWNDAAEKMYGYSAKEVMGRHVSLLIPKDRRREMLQILEKIKQGERTLSIETTRLHKDGHPVHVSLTVSPIIGKAGELLGAASIARDITRRKQSEDLIHEQAAWNQLILDTTLDGFILADTEGKIVDVNASYCRLVGYTRAELLAMNIRQVEAQLSDREVNRRIKQMVSAGFDRFETQHHAKDGRILDLDVSITIVQAKDRPPKVAAFVRDISGQKAAQEALRESEENLRITLNSIGDAVIATDAAGKITAINPVAARLTGWPHDEAIGQPIGRVFHIVNALSMEKVDNPAELVIKTGEIVGLANHTMLLSKDGKKYQIADSGAPIRTANRETVGAVLVFRDVTTDYEKEQQLKLLNLKLKQAQEIAGVGWWEWNIQSGEINFSEELAQLHGLPQSKRTHTLERWLKYVYPHDRTVLRSSLDASFSTGALQAEFRIKRHDNKELRFFKAKGIVRFSAAGEPEYQFGVAIDVTEEERAKESLRESEEKFSKAFMASPVLKTITRMNSGEIIDVNDSFLRHTGYSREELIGMKTTDLDLWADPRQRREILHILASGKMVRNEEVQVRTKSGDIIDTFYSTDKVVIENEDCLISIAVDVTQRKQAQEALEESERHYRALFENSPVPLWEEDFSQVNKQIVALKKQGVKDFHKYFADHPDEIRKLAGLVRILDVNLAVLELYEAKTREELFQGLTAVFKKDSFDAFRNELIAIADGRSLCEFEGAVQTLTGEEKVVRLNWAVVPGYEKTLERVYVATQDFTKLKRAENTLQENEKLLRKITENFPNSYLSIIGKDFTVGFTAGREFKKQGLNPEDYVGMTIEQAFGDDAAFIRKHCEKTFEGEERSFELSINDQYHYYRTVPLYAEDGSIPRILVVAENISARKLAEIALAQSEERFRLAFHTSPDSININRLKDGLYVDINQGFSTLTGYNREEVIGKTSLEINIWADPADRRRLVEGLKTQGRVINLEAQFRMKDGTVVTGLMSASVIMLQDEAHILSITRNIENMKQLERERQVLLDETEAARKLLSDVFSRINDGVVALDKDWRYSYLNEQAAKMLNREKPEDLLGKHIWSEYPEGMEQPFYKAYYKAMKTQKVIYLQDHYMPWNRWFENRIYPSPDGLTIYLTDITERKQAENALKESEARFRTVVDQAGDALYVADFETERILFTNKQACTMLGYSQEELLQFKVSDLDPVFIAEEHKKKLWRQFVPGETRTIEVLHKRKDGSTIPVEVRTGVIEFAGKKAILGYARDVSERKQALKEITQLSRIIETSKQAMVIANLQGEVVYVNGGLLAMLGYDDKQDVLGRPIFSFTNKEGVSKLNEEIIPALLSKGHWQGEINNKRKDGSFFPAEEMCSVTRDEQGEPEYYVLVFADITDRKRIEEAVKESQRQLQTLFSNLPGMAYRCKNNENRSMEFVSDGALPLTGYAPSDLVNDKKIAFADLIHPEDRKFVWDQVQASLESKKKYELEYRIIQQNKQERWVWERGAGVFEDDQLLALEGFISDVTERKRAEDKVHQLNAELEQRVQKRTAQLQAANQDLEAFAYSVSHDLRAPLRHIAGFTGMLQRDLLKEEPRPDYYFQKISRAADNMRDMIDDLLAFSRIGRTKFAKVDVDLNDLVAAVVSEFEQDIAGRDIQWKIEKLHPVKGDVNLLKSVLENLISNAVKFTAEQQVAEIEIGSSTDAQYVRVHVKDNGVGFDENYVHKLFHVFQRLHSDEKFPGTGIGLANVKRIIERHGGSVGAQGREGGGALFYFTLPRS